MTDISKKIMFLRIYRSTILYLKWQSSKANLGFLTTWKFNNARRKGLKDWISLKEISWPQFKSGAQQGHYWKIFLARNMVDSHHVPHHNILVLNPPIPAIFTISKQVLIIQHQESFSSYTHETKLRTEITTCSLRFLLN